MLAGGGEKLMGSEDEVISCIGERKVKRDGEHRGQVSKSVA